MYYRSEELNDKLFIQYKAFGAREAPGQCQDFVDG